MTKTAALLAALSTIALAPGWARAQDPEVEASAPEARYAFGARVGGYGFRNTEHAGAGEWDDCRMDGFGLFAQRTLTRYLFAEAGFDLYSAADPVPSDDMVEPGMDRISGVTTVAAGARIPWRYFSPYVQAGLGLEITRAKMAEHGLEDRAVVPMGFVGIGAELRVTQKFSIGGNVRTNVMKHYVHDEQSLDLNAEPTVDMRSEFDTAAQGQIFVRYEM